MLRRAGTASIGNLISFERRLEARIAAVVVVVPHAAELQAVVSKCLAEPSRDVPKFSTRQNLEVQSSEKRRRLDGVGDGRVDYCWL